MRCSGYCDLSFLENGYKVELHFYDIYLKDAVEMADKVKILLDKFQKDGKRFGHLAQMTKRGKVGVFKADASLSFFILRREIMAYIQITKSEIAELRQLNDSGKVAIGRMIFVKII